MPSIPSSQSAGVMSMQIFCFDFTMATHCRSRGMGPGFLIHDSHLYEPVDGRQFARALRIGAEYAEEIGIQYVVTLNSDELARAETEGNEDFRSFVLAPVLSDAPEEGLFGIRFDRTRCIGSRIAKNRPASQRYLAEPIMTLTACLSTEDRPSELPTASSSRLV